MSCAALEEQLTVRDGSGGMNSGSCRKERVCVSSQQPGGTRRRSYVTRASPCCFTCSGLSRHFPGQANAGPVVGVGDILADGRSAHRFSESGSVLVEKFLKNSTSCENYFLCDHSSVLLRISEGDVLTHRPTPTYCYPFTGRSAPSPLLNGTHGGASIRGTVSCRNGRWAAVTENESVRWSLHAGL